MKSLRPGTSVLALAMAAVLMAAPAAQAANVPAPVPKDAPYPGMLTVDVNLEQAPRRIFHVHGTVPVESGPVTLHYPKWTPCEHAPTSPIANVAGLVIKGNGKKIAWRRDLVDVEFNPVAFHPAGYYARDTRIRPTVRWPAGWKFASAMDVPGRDGDIVKSRK